MSRFYLSTTNKMQEVMFDMFSRSVGFLKHSSSRSNYSVSQKLRYKHYPFFSVFCLEQPGSGSVYPCESNHPLPPINIGVLLFICVPHVTNENNGTIVARLCSSSAKLLQILTDCIVLLSCRGSQNGRSSLKTTCPPSLNDTSTTMRSRDPFAVKG